MYRTKRHDPQYSATMGVTAARVFPAAAAASTIAAAPACRSAQTPFEIAVEQAGNSGPTTTGSFCWIHAAAEGDNLLLALSTATATPLSTLAAALLLLHRIQPCQAPRVRQWKIRERAASPPSLYQHEPFYLPSSIRINKPNNQPLTTQDGRGYWTQIATVLAAHHSFIHCHRSSLNHRHFVRITIFCSRRRWTSSR